jgi:hypothetical protein
MGEDDWRVNHILSHNVLDGFIYNKKDHLEKEKK